LQNVDYRYNARGWLTNINNGGLSNDPLTSIDGNDQFGMDLKYDDAAIPQYNGNIGNVKTLTGILAVTGAVSYPALTYNYTYDKLNRLTDAISTTGTVGDGFYSENLTYDNMGNIQTLKRYEKNGASALMIDNLNYLYPNGNRVDRIDDSGTAAGFDNLASQSGEYTYDGNGNQLTDLNRGLTQAYNMLNLPQTATKSGVSIAYIYDATGRKLRKLSTSSGTTTVTEYIGGIQYQYSTATPALDFISTEEGRARKSGSVYKYEYDLKDHLGNTRITTTWNASDPTQMTPANSQRSDYYAFGYVIQSLTGTLPSSPNHYLYNHKELQDETGLYDYGARFYDPVIAKWTSMDPLAEISRRFSPYNYVENNPMRNIDPDGMETVDLGSTALEGLNTSTTLRGAAAQSFFREEQQRDKQRKDKKDKKDNHARARLMDVENRFQAFGVT
jgi:RHS repeat-associated protein